MKINLACRSALFFFLSMSVGCESKKSVYEINGANSKFCVPSAYAVKDIPWAPRDKSTTIAVFAFQGCNALGITEKADCKFPHAIQGGVIAPAYFFSRTQWKDMPEDSFQRRISVDPSSDILLLESDNLLVVSNKKLWDAWYIWKKNARNNIKKISLGDEDEILATCQAKGIARKDKAGKDYFSCSRTVVMNDFSVRYSFLSNDEIPRNISKLDHGLSSALDSWRCK